jgi:hypothetical protein
MKRLFYTLALFFLSTVFVLAEDVIYFNNGTQQKGTVVEISTTEIKYRKAENPSGPLYIIPRTDVQMIEYANGEKDIITANNNNNNSNQNDQANNNNNNSGRARNQDTYINNYYTNPRPQVHINVPPPVWGWGYVRPHYWGGFHHHHHRRGCW